MAYGPSALDGPWHRQCKRCRGSRVAYSLQSGREGIENVGPLPPRSRQLDTSKNPDGIGLRLTHWVVRAGQRGRVGADEVGVAGDHCRRRGPAAAEGQMDQRGVGAFHAVCVSDQRRDEMQQRADARIGSSGRVAMYQPAFFDVLEHLKGLSEAGDPLEAMDGAMDFEAFRPVVAAALATRTARKPVGRPTTWWRCSRR